MDLRKTVLKAALKAIESTAFKEPDYDINSSAKSAMCDSEPMPSLGEQLAFVERSSMDYGYNLGLQHGVRVPLEVRRRTPGGGGVLETYYADERHLRVLLTVAMGTSIPEGFAALVTKAQAHIIAFGGPSLVSSSVKQVGTLLCVSEEYSSFEEMVAEEYKHYKSAYSVDDLIEEDKAGDETMRLNEMRLNSAMHAMRLQEMQRNSTMHVASAMNRANTMSQAMGFAPYKVVNGVPHYSGGF